MSVSDSVSDETRSFILVAAYNELSSGMLFIAPSKTCMCESSFRISLSEIKSYVIKHDIKYISNYNESKILSKAILSNILSN